MVPSLCAFALSKGGDREGALHVCFCSHKWTSQEGDQEKEEEGEEIFWSRFRLYFLLNQSLLPLSPV